MIDFISYGTLRFVTVFTKAHITWSWASSNLHIIFF